MIELNPREKKLLIGAIIFLAPIVSYRLVIAPLQNYRQRLERSIVIKKKKLKKIELLSQEYKFLKSRTNLKSISLVKRVENIINNQSLKDRARISIEDNIETGQRLLLKLDELTLEEIAMLIHRIEDLKPVVKIIRLETFASYQNEKLLQVTLSLQSL